MSFAQHIPLFTTTLWSWFAVHKRTLPWRNLVDESPESRAYKVLVSEIMLQQTQVDPVIEKFNRFIDTFPDIHTLASATNAQMLLAWKGLGYNRRALNLRNCAIAINELGAFPRRQEELLALPGIGPYCSGAILNFAFDLPTPCIDTNIRRILHRTFYGPENRDGTWAHSDRELLPLCEEILEVALRGNKKSSDWFAALMDFGSLVQTQKYVDWDNCPLTAKKLMKATSENTPVSYIRKTKKEPGQMIGGTFVPRRLIRGMVIEVLRNQLSDVSLQMIGKSIKPDWSKGDAPWLKQLLEQLSTEGMVQHHQSKYSLKQ